MKIYTKTGDDGSTGLFSGERVPKYTLRVNAYGTLDELNAHIGLITTLNVPEPLLSHLIKFNNLLFIAGTDLATRSEADNKRKIDRITSNHVSMIEKLIDEYTNQLPELKSFILPGGTQIAASLHIARTVCRRTERLIVELSEHEEVNSNLIIFFNRLSDYLFTAARYANKLLGVEDTKREIDNF